MVCKRLRHPKNTAARPEPDACSRHGAGPRGQLPIESSKAFDRIRAVASPHGIQYRIELEFQIETPRDAAKTNDLGACRKSSQELCALQRLGLVRQRGQA